MRRYPTPYLPKALRVRCSGFGRRASLFDLRSSRFALRASLLGLRSSNFALRTSLFGLRSSNFALRPSLSDLRSPSFALRASPFGLNIFLRPVGLDLRSSFFSLPLGACHHRMLLRGGVAASMSRARAGRPPGSGWRQDLQACISAIGGKAVRLFGSVSTDRRDDDLVTLVVGLLTRVAGGEGGLPALLGAVQTRVGRATTSGDRGEAVVRRLGSCFAKYEGFGPGRRG